MKKHMGKRVLSFVLSVLLLVGSLPADIAAIESGVFVLAAEGNGALIIAPEYVSYSAGQTVREALAASGHSFTGLADGWITEIDGVTGNFSRSDEDGGFDLDAPASGVEYYRFSEDASSQPSTGLQKLMTAMAAYQQKDADVQAAAKDAYDTAYDQFVGLDSDSAAALAENLNAAVSSYEQSQTGTRYQVTFADGSSVYSGADITAQNAYGKVWTDDGDGVLELPAGAYNFCVSRDGLRAEGMVSVSADATVTAALPEQLWLDLDAFRLSGSYGAEENEDNRFSDDEYTLQTWNGRQTTVTVPDTFTGKVYTYAMYRTDLLAAVPTLTAVYPSARTGEETRQTIPFGSLTSGAADVLKKGSVGNTVIYRVSSKGTDGYIYSQDYTVIFERLPSLASIRVSDQNGVDQTATAAFDANVTDYTYKVVDSVTSVTVKAQPLEDRYAVTVNGRNAAQGVSVDLAQDGDTTILVTVSADGYTNTYTLTICPGEGRNLSFVTERADVTLEVVNSNGEVLPCEKFREGTSGNRYQYTLVPGETYSYVATAGTYYHLADEFTMEDAADSTIRVDVPTQDWLSELAFGEKKAGSYKNSLPLDADFSASDHSYQVSYVDTEHLAYVWAASEESDVSIQAIYDQVFGSSLYHGKEQVKALTSGAATGVQLNRFLMDENPIENTLTIRLTRESDGVTCYQDYIVEFTRKLTLEDLSAKCDGATVMLARDDGTTGFDPLVKDYSVTVSMAADCLELSMAAYADNPCYGEETVGYRIKVNGTDVTEAGSAVIALDGTIETQDVSILVENDKAPDGSAEYTLHILKSPPVAARFDIMPENALLTLHETMSGERLRADEDGTFQLCEGYSYAYALTEYGYVSKSGTLTVTRDAENALVITDGSDTYTVEESAVGGAAEISWSLAAAQTNSSINTELSALWPNFRGSDTNNAVVDAPIPTAAEDGTLYWANQIGSGIDADAVGSPIIVDGALITYASDKIYRVDTLTGEIVAAGTMDHKSSFSITPPAYAEGMVFVALSNGTVQAFNADTLESLWLYMDPLGGQPNSPLTVKDGYLYTGFWNSETGDANFVCLSITDENPSEPKERKCASWYHTAKGGYYWAGAYAGDGFVLVGTDDGTNTCTAQSARLLMLNAKTGELLDSLDGLNGDIRSTVVYDSLTDSYCFTSKGGSFYSVQVSGSELTNLWSAALRNGSGSTPMSTCSPVVYNGRAYVGVSGAGQFASYSGHNVTVIDLNKKAIAYSVQTQGHPQTSGLLTTAYEEESGYVYIYFFDNMTPGKLRVLRDKAGQTAADYVTMEGSSAAAYALFTPTGDQAQYAICSPIADEYGTIYFKNDSAHLMAFGSAIEKIEVTTLPEKTVYADGDAFDPAGMVVTATYANGKTRDVTRYVTFDVETVTPEATQITVSFPYVMYHNEENGTGMASGIATATPVTTVSVSIGEKDPENVTPGDVNGDGQTDTADANMIIAYYYGSAAFTPEQEACADVNGDGEVDTDDANRIIAYYYGNAESLNSGE